MTVLRVDQGSNNTNKFNPQERVSCCCWWVRVQIIQINSILKNLLAAKTVYMIVQIIQINSILKNPTLSATCWIVVQIIQINSILKNTISLIISFVMFK